MLNLLKADLYRITRPRGLRGSFWQYGLALLAVYVFIFTVFWLLSTPDFLYSLNSPDVSTSLTFTTVTSCLSEMTLGIVPLCAAFMTVELALGDFKNGFVSSVVSARRGRLSFFAEKILVAGVISAIVIVAASVLVLVGAFVAGAVFTQAEDAAGIAVWFFGVWLNCWALAALSLILVYATRVNPVSYIGAFCFCASVMPQALLALAAASGSSLHFLAPIAPALQTLAAWMPSSALGNLQGGGAALVGSSASATINTQFDLFEAGACALAIDPAAQVMLTGIIWIALAGALVLAIARTRDI